MTTDGWRRYRYVGPAGLRATVRPGAEGCPIGSYGDLDAWAAEHGTAEPFTFVVDTAGRLLLAPRRSEHIACAGGRPVLAAGEIGFVRQAAGWQVSEVTNQSTGYCPDLPCWTAVARALDRAGLARPEGFTHEVVFRRCPSCRRIGIVRDEDYHCVFCDTAVPRTWNVTPDGPEIRSAPGSRR
ncbi:hypothetical protein [Kitasatospora sp. NPDC059571]|uniref:hypothetical protein n=1 Tax=Kitasatospora sp. NPDC059571 TaxID=3346871 RepID=UPI003695072A